MFIMVARFIGLSVINPLKCVLVSNQECKVRPFKMNINSYDASIYPYSILVNKCSSSCNNVDDSYAMLCVPDVVKSMNVRVFNLMSRTNETRHISWHEACICKCRLDARVCNDKQRRNNEKSRCECK